MSMNVTLGADGFVRVGVEIPEAQVFAPYRDGVHAAEMADQWVETLARIQWRGWDADRGIRCCPLCHAPEKHGRHFGSCVVGQALDFCPQCEGKPLPDVPVANGPEYTMDVPRTCDTCGRSDSDYYVRPL